MKKVLFLSVTTIVLFLPGSQIVYAHPGGLDDNGGHVDKSTGIYHCHRAGCVVRPKARVENSSVTTTRKFNRNEWGNWKDVDGDCQNSRAEVLQRDSLIPVSFTNKKSCAVARGQWHDPYTGDQFNHPFSLDIDHIVPLEWAHHHGGAEWSKQRKQAFTNDLDNLLAAGAGVNRYKGAQGPDRWLPFEESFQCIYLARFLHIYEKYDLRFVAAEQRAITPITISCDLTIHNN